MNIDRQLLLDFVEPFYHDKNRYFHNFDHILSAEKYFEKMSDEQFVAWLFHDIVYIPDHNDNEEKSADFLYDYFQFNELNVDLGLCIQIIHDTKKHISTTPESQYILDIDMLCFSLSYDEFYESREAVFHEYSPFYGETETRKGIKNFLNNMSGKQIYFSSDFLDRNERAMRNIERYIS